MFYTFIKSFVWPWSLDSGSRSRLGSHSLLLYIMNKMNEMLFFFNFRMEVPLFLKLYLVNPKMYDSCMIEQSKREYLGMWLFFFSKYSTRKGG